MSLGRRSFAVFLAMTPGIGGRSIVRILTRNDLLARSPEEFLALSAEALAEEYKLGPKAVNALTNNQSELLREAAETETRMNELGVTLVTLADANYPERIEVMDPDPPGMLFMYGNHKLLEASTFAVLSSRGSPGAALDELEALAEEGVLAGNVLVSGHDTPEYQRSAVVPLRWGAPRILVLDRGLYEGFGKELRSEPFRAARLWRYEYDPHTDLAISPFRPHAKYVGINNQVRDRLIASLADRLDFVDVKPTGNMEKCLRLALKAGRKVRVCDRSLGYRDYVREGAEPIRS